MIAAFFQHGKHDIGQLTATWLCLLLTASSNYQLNCISISCPVFSGMEFHEELPRLGEKEGLKGHKQSKALESFTWNITVLKVHTHTRDTIHLIQ